MLSPIISCLVQNVAVLQISLLKNWIWWNQSCYIEYAESCFQADTILQVWFYFTLSQMRWRVGLGVVVGGGGIVLVWICQSVNPSVHPFICLSIWARLSAQLLRDYFSNLFLYLAGICKYFAPVQPWVPQLIRCVHNWPKSDYAIVCLPEVIWVRAVALVTFGLFIMLVEINHEFYRIYIFLYIFDEIWKFCHKHIWPCDNRPCFYNNWLKFGSNLFKSWQRYWQDKWDLSCGVDITYDVQF